MDNGGTRFAVGLLVLWGALLLMFIALHPNGINFPAGSKPGASGALQWLIGEFQTVTGLADVNTSAPTTPNNASASPAETGA